MFTLFNEWLMVGCFCAVLLYDHIVFSQNPRKLKDKVAISLTWLHQFQQCSVLGQLEGTIELCVSFYETSGHHEEKYLIHHDRSCWETFAIESDPYSAGSSFDYHLRVLSVSLLFSQTEWKSSALSPQQALWRKVWLATGSQVPST